LLARTLLRDARLQGGNPLLKGFKARCLYQSWRSIKKPRRR